MKKLLIIVAVLGLTAAANAQHVVGRYHYARPRVYTGGYYAPFYPYYYGYSPFYPYPPFGYPNNYDSRPSKMSLKIEDIRNDYQDKIWSARHDTNLPRKERRQKVHELKHQRDQEIADLKRNYYKY
jgi:hypothetical protein